MTKQPSDSERVDAQKKERVQLDFTLDALARLDELKKIIGASTRAETIRQALRFFSWFMTETDTDDMITITAPDGKIVSKFKASLVHTEQKSATKLAREGRENPSSHTSGDG